MSFGTRLKRIGFDFYLVLLVGTVVLATLLPARGVGTTIVEQASYYAVALLFFLYGAKLNTAAILVGISNLKLQGQVFASTYIAFPILGLIMSYLLAPLLPPQIIIGIVYLSVLPSTVQSSIAFTSIAHGNVPAAVCAASVSNVIGVFLTPAFAAVLLHTSGGGVDASAILDIGMQILLPFIVGQLARPLVGKFIHRHAKLTQIVDRGSILLIVYSAFSAGVVAGIWQQVDISTLAIMIVADIVMLAIIMFGTSFMARVSGLDRADGIVLLFCGSKKSLASGLPMANILFAGQTVSLIVLPLMIFHQIQLFVCAIIAQREAHKIQEIGHGTAPAPANS